MPSEPTTTMELPDAQRRPVVAVQLSCESYAESWQHCQQVADFVARVAASDRFDAERHTTLFSNFINELLELVFRMHAPGRAVVLQVFKVVDELLLELTVPVDGETEAAYRELFAGLEAGDHREFLRTHIHKVSGKVPSTETSLYELAGIFEMKLNLRAEEAGRSMLLSMPISFE
ncbi:MAG: hypothetical protein KC636_04915 [Myxococcales bacterium]|nr:hypothetical protein [Myxococcales bacterium]